MAMVLPVLRLWLLLLNIYGTFKSMKPPPQSQRSARNHQGPSARAMQLHKRGLKSCLAAWVVWAVFSTMESPLDRTVGLVTPFYHEFKCIVFLFLLVARSHGAEAIFLYIIHPLLRPYVPAVDDVLAKLHSVFDLLTLLFILPWEYVSYWWHHWSWRRKSEPAGDDSSRPTGHGAGDGGQPLLDQGRRLRTRNDMQQARLRETEQQAHVVFQDIDDAQRRLRTRTRSQPSAPVSRNNVRNQPIRGGRGAVGDPMPKAVGLRTRKRVQPYPPLESGLALGSTTTGIHHVDLPHTDGLPQVPVSRPFPAFPHAPTTQPGLLPSQPANPIPIQTPPASRYEIWHPPQSALEAHARRSPSPDESVPQMVSPIYPPLPSAYPFTPRRSELPPSPGIVPPSDLVAPTPRRASTDAASWDGIDAFDGVDLPARHSNPAGSRNAHSVEPSLPGDKQQRMQAEDFFGQALELSIQAADMDMDMETETLSTRDSSSASEEAMEVGGDDVGADQIGSVASRRSGGPRTRGERGLELKEGQATATEPLRRSTRTRRDRSSSVETDEFGFTIRPESAATRSRGVASLLAGASKKKPLARTKPAQGDGDETASSDEDIAKKRRKLRPGTVAKERDSRLQGDEDEDRRKEEADPGVTLQRRDNGTMRGRDKRKAAARKADAAQVVSTVKLGHTRATRASTRQRIVSREGDLQGAGVNKRGKG